MQSATAATRLITIALLAMAITRAQTAQGEPSSATDARATQPTTRRTDSASVSPFDDQIASIDDDIRFLPATRPTIPDPQRPPLTTEKNVDTGKPLHEWQRATDDWLGARPRLDDRGISFAASLTLDFTKNLRGGVDTAGSASNELFNANLTLDTKRLFGWEGGTFFFSFQNHSGQNASRLVGSVQSIDGIEAPGRTQITEAWYEQKLFDGALRIKVGKIDANADFAVNDVGGAFLNASPSASPTILDLPTFPDSAFGASFFVSPNETFYAGAGVFDGAAQEGVQTGSRGPASLFGAPADLFLIAEAGVKWGKNLPGKLSIGLWHHTGNFSRFDGGADQGATGPYVILTQRVWKTEPGKDDDDRGISVFAQYGHADPRISAIQHHVAAGATWTGPFPTRNDDVLGLAATWVRLSEDDGAGFTRDSELAVEVFYEIRALKWLRVKTDLQYIKNPGGNSDRGDALAATVRLVMDF